MRVGAPVIGSSYTLTSIAAAVLGGAALTGGRGSFVGAMLGALFFTLTVNVITLLAVCCALFLIAATMNTLIVEQAGQIAILASLGARRHQVADVVLRTAGLLGGVGAIAGTALGVAISCALTSYFAATLFDVRAGFAISVPVVAASSRIVRLP